MADGTAKDAHNICIFLVRPHLIVLLGIHIGRSDVDGLIHILTSSSVLVRVNLHKNQLLYVHLFL